MKTFTWLLLFSILFFGCVSNTHNTATNQNNPTTLLQNSSVNDSIRVELYHFHGTHQCPSCIKVGELAEKTVNTYFKDELESGKLVFSHINGELPENQNLVNQYGVTGSSLWIGTYMDGEFYKEQNINVWYKINNEEDYLNYLRDIIEKRLSGELN